MAKPDKEHCSKCLRALTNGKCIVCEHAPNGWFDSGQSMRDQQVRILIAKTGTLHIGEVHKSKNPPYKPFVWPVCGNHDSKHEKSWMEMQDLMGHHKFCGSCERNIKFRDKLFSNVAYTDLCDLLPVLFAPELVKRVPTRIDDVIADYDYLAQRVRVCYRGKVSQSYSKDWLNQRTKKLSEAVDMMSSGPDVWRSGDYAIQVNLDVGSQTFPVRLSFEQTKLGRDQIILRLIAESIVQEFVSSFENWNLEDDTA